MKIKKATRRADTSEDHVHKLPDGSFTGGMLMKPCKDQSAMHSHLYENGEDTAETASIHNFGDHVHRTLMGVTSGPMKPDKMPGKPWKKMDSVSRQGTEFVVTSETGHVIGRGKTEAEALDSCKVEE